MAAGLPKAGKGSAGENAEVTETHNGTHSGKKGSFL